MWYFRIIIFSQFYDGQSYSRYINYKLLKNNNIILWKSPIKIGKIGFIKSMFAVVFASLNFLNISIIYKQNGEFLVVYQVLYSIRLCPGNCNFIHDFTLPRRKAYSICWSWGILANMGHGSAMSRPCYGGW